jgi:hypothetical protein
VAALVPSAGTITLQIELRSDADAVSTPHPVRVRIAARRAALRRPFPHYVSEDRSEMRGIKPGWYAMEDDGDLLFQAFFQSLGMRH